MPFSRPTQITARQSHQPASQVSLASGILVNLLPTEELQKRKHSVRLALINKISIGILAALIFFTSAAFALRLSQNFELQNAQIGLARAEAQVTNLKGKEEQAFILKERLAAISNLLGGDSKRKAIFNLVVFLTPTDILISEASVDRGGNMNLSLKSPTISSIETLISNLGNKEKNADLIAKVSLEGLSLGKDSIYHFSLKIIPKN